MRQTVTVDEAARRLGVSRRTIYRRIEAGEIRVVKTEPPTLHTYVRVDLPPEDEAQTA